MKFFMYIHIIMQSYIVSILFIVFINNVGSMSKKTNRETLLHDKPGAKYLRNDKYSTSPFGTLIFSSKFYIIWFINKYAWAPLVKRLQNNITYLNTYEKLICSEEISSSKVSHIYKNLTGPQNMF